MLLLSHQRIQIKTIVRIMRMQPGDFFFLSLKWPSGRWRDYAFARDGIVDGTVGDLDDIPAFVAEHLALNIYFVPHAFNAPTRRKIHAVLPCCLFADMDGVGPDVCSPEPTIIWRTSPRRYSGIWLTDKPITEQLNRRLTYVNGFDHGGWDLTQLLRLPGTFNYKRDPPTPTKLLWADGPRYRIADLERMLPLLPERPRHNGHSHSNGERKASKLPMEAIIKRYPTIRFGTREKLLGEGQVGGERRHRMHWRLACELHEANVPEDEAATLLIGTAWNKHDSDEPVWGMIKKIWSEL